ncbi:DUF4412 domain-containing protein [Rhodohalobacter sp. 8-1]|uniref:DUF4412 domain-containing protein n=1 Tax=Rhodohalobacter sp. 8-1 TaxID=3131972 RepID=UPI0030EC3F07
MRELIAFLILMMLSLAFATTADAQLFNRLKDRAKKAAENKVEEKLSNEVEKAAERAVEKTWQSIFGEEFGEEGDGINVSFTMNSDAVTEESYSFDMITTMQVETVRENGNSDGPMIMKMHFNNTESYSGTQFSGEEMDDSEGEMFMIYDLKNESMVMLMESDDGKYSFAYDWKQAQQLAKDFDEMETDQEMNSDTEMETKTDAEYTDKPQNFEEIGTKTIAGLECRGYRSETEESVIEYWVTEDEDVGIYKMLRVNEQTKHLKGNVPKNYPTGTLMEMVQEDLNSGEKTSMRVTDINRNASVTYTMSDYPAMSFGGGSQDQQ